ncbi:MAG: hypothetical protein GY861_21460 [bacterium]|nr:hypothetical protein [bacterium]
MRKELEKILVKTFPTLYCDYDKHYSESLLAFGFDCFDGWFDLIYQLSSDLISTNDSEHNVVAAQVKEKFGGLRFYVYYASPEQYQIVNNAKKESYKICEKCGTRGGVTTGRSDGSDWISTLCSRCRGLQAWGRVLNTKNA